MSAVHPARARVIVADDHQDIRSTIGAILDAHFDVVAGVDDGAAAIEAAIALQPDVAVLDVSMPGVDGFRAAEMIASRTTSRIVFLSNYAGADYVLAGLSRGASAFVVKADMERDLVAAVRHTIAGRMFVPDAGVLPRWRRAAHRHHDLQLYDHERGLIDAVANYFESALECGEAIIAVASLLHLQAFEARLKAGGFPLAEALSSGRYSRMDADAALEAVTSNGVPRAERFAAALDPLLDRGLAASSAAVPHVTMYGEIAPILCARGEVESMVELESIADDYTRTHPISILCGYTAGCLADDANQVSERICGGHAVILSAR